MMWQVTFTGKAAKGAERMPQREQEILFRLVQDLKHSGPVQPRWKNYSRLGKGEHHCHLSYKWVACWRVENDEVRLIEIYYAGSRENAPY
jgi:mRNA-degrading endonuclease RelE of RelBE toxin-antitoxin system